jgi:hypothetical protein
MRSAHPHLLPNATPTSDAIVYLIVVFLERTAAIQVDAPPSSLIFVGAISAPQQRNRRR